MSEKAVIPAKAGIPLFMGDSRMRGNDEAANYIDIISNHYHLGYKLRNTLDIEMISLLNVE